MQALKIRRLAEGAVIAAFYAVLTMLSAMLGVAYPAIQLRFSEALTILPVFTPAAVPGLAIGCLLSNLASPFGVIDWIFGTLATFLGALLTRALRKIRFKRIPYLAPLPPVLTNGLFIGGMVAFLLPEGFSFAAFLAAGLEVGAGQLIVCYGLGLPLAALLEKSSAAKHLFR